MYTLQVSTIQTIIVALVKLIFGIIYSSIWFFSNAFFYAILCFSRYRSIRDYKKAKIELDINKKKKIAYENYLYNGGLLSLLGLAYLGMNAFMYQSGVTNNTLSGYLVYIVSLISISSLIRVNYKLVKIQKKI